jgi:hypothetical protein
LTKKNIRIGSESSDMWPLLSGWPATSAAGHPCFLQASSRLGGEYGHDAGGGSYNNIAVHPLPHRLTGFTRAHAWC